MYVNGCEIYGYSFVLLFWGEIFVECKIDVGLVLVKVDIVEREIIK